MTPFTLSPDGHLESLVSPAILRTHTDRYVPIPLAPSPSLAGSYALLRTPHGALPHSPPPPSHTSHLAGRDLQHLSHGGGDGGEGRARVVDHRVVLQPLARLVALATMTLERLPDSVRHTVSEGYLQNPGRTHYSVVHIQSA